MLPFQQVLRQLFLRGRCHFCWDETGAQNPRWWSRVAERWRNGGLQMCSASMGWATPANFSGPSNKKNRNREAIKINKVSIWIYAWVTKAPKYLCLAILVGSNDSAPLQVGDRPSPVKIAKAGHLPTKMFHSFSTSKFNSKRLYIISMCSSQVVPIFFAAHPFGHDSSPIRSGLKMLSGMCRSVGEPKKLQE